MTPNNPSGIRPSEIFGRPRLWAILSFVAVTACGSATVLVAVLHKFVMEELIVSLDGVLSNYAIGAPTVMLALLPLTLYLPASPPWFRRLGRQEAVRTALPRIGMLGIWFVGPYVLLAHLFDSIGPAVGLGALRDSGFQVVAFVAAMIVTVLAYAHLAMAWYVDSPAKKKLSRRAGGGSI